MISQNITTNYLDEQELIKEILKGNKSALFFFWQKYQPKLRGYIRQKIEEGRDADELLQDTFLAGLEGLRDFKGNCSLYTYLYSIARYKVIDYYRRKKIKQIVFSRLPGFQNLISQVLSPEERLIRKELKQKTRSVFLKIAPEQAKIIYLKYEKGLTIKEIAKEVGLTIKAVESRLFRARLAFIKAFNEDFNNEEKNFKKFNQKAERDLNSPP